MLNFRKKKQMNPEGIQLIGTMMMCYPILSAVEYDPKQRNFKLSFALREEISREKFDDLVDIVGESIHTYHALEGLIGTTIEFLVEGQGELAFFHLMRDIDSFSRGELTMVSSLMKERFKDVLITYGSEEDYGRQGHYDGVEGSRIDALLENLRESTSPSRLVGVREEDHVTVFDR